MKMYEEQNYEVGRKSELWGMETTEKKQKHGQWCGGPGESDGKTWLRTDPFDFLERKGGEVRRGLPYFPGQDPERVRQVATTSERKRVRFKAGVW